MEDVMAPYRYCRLEHNANELYKEKLCAKSKQSAKVFPVNLKNAAEHMSSR